jgi:hypothetical protein
LQKRQHHILSCNQTIQLPLEDLVQSWQKTASQVTLASPEHALNIVDSFLKALPLTLRYNEHFLVQHILLSKANLYYKRFVLWEQQSCNSMPDHIRIQAQHLYFKQSQHFLSSVDPKLLKTESMDPITCSTAQHTYSNLKLLIDRDEQRIVQKVKDLSENSAFLSMIS